MVMFRCVFVTYVMGARVQYVVSFIIEGGITSATWVGAYCVYFLGFTMVIRTIINSNIATVSGTLYATTQGRGHVFSSGDSLTIFRGVVFTTSVSSTVHHVFGHTIRSFTIFTYGIGNVNSYTLRNGAVGNGVKHFFYSASCVFVTY